MNTASKGAGISLSPKALSRRMFLSGSAALGTAAFLPTITGCGSDNSTSSSGPTELTWSTWGNPEELTRLQEFNDQFDQDRDDIATELIFVPNDGYDAKLLTQLNGGTAPDLFYAGEALITQLIANDLVVPLADRLDSDASESPLSDFFSQLGQAGRRDDEVYGVTVDCNPHVIWYNKGILDQLGISTHPAEQFEAGQWDRDAFQAIADAAKAAGMTAGVVRSNWTDVYAWMSANGGTIYADGEFVAHEDDRAVEAFVWLTEMIRSGTFAYAGGMPSGQTGDSLFLSGNIPFQLAGGRYFLPRVVDVEGLEYDIVPFPSPDGALPSTPISASYMVINKKAENIDAAFEFLTNYVSAEGQTFRLEGGGNAVPSVKGADDVVIADDVPAHAQFWLDLRETGYTNPTDQAATPGLSQEIVKQFDLIWAQEVDPREGLDNLATIVNEMIAEARDDA